MRIRELGQHIKELDTEASPEMHEDICHYGGSGHSLSTSNRDYLRHVPPH